MKKRGLEVCYLEHSNKLRCNWDFCTSLSFYHYFLILCNSRRVSRSECLNLYSRDCFYSFYPFELKVCRMVELLYSKQSYAFLFSSIWTGFLCEKNDPISLDLNDFFVKKKWLVTAPDHVKMGKWWRITIPLLHSDNDEESVRVCYCCHKLLLWQMTCFVCL